MSGVLRGALLTVAMRWTDRLIGFASTLILARLLVPGDFGIIAMASLVIGLTEILFDIGVHVPLIQNKDPSQGHYNTAWTLRLLQSIVVAALVVGSSTWTADYFNEPRLPQVVQVLALSFLVGGLENIGIVTFQKEMKFGSDFQFLFWRRVAGFSATMVAAWLLQSYWAMVIGSLVGRFAGVWLSYAMHPMRPRICFDHVREILGVSLWLLMRNASQYLDLKLHLFVVGRRESAATMGAYSLADDIAAMPTTELLAPINRVLFPALVRVKHDAVELKRAFLLSQGVQTLIGLPAGVGLALVANELVLVLLGEKWSSAAPFLGVFALMNVANALSSSSIYLLLTLDHAKKLAIYSWIQVLLFILAALLVFPTGGALNVAWIRLGISLIGLLTYFFFLLTTLKSLSARELASTIYRPAISALAMAACVLLAADYSELSGAALLVLKVLVGAVTYMVATAALWIAARRPYGPESYAFDLIKTRFGTRTAG